MTLKRRLDKLESALPARTAALRWMCEAHRFGSMVAYVDWLGGQPRSAFPLNLVPAQAIAAAAAATKVCLPGMPPMLTNGLCGTRCSWSTSSSG
jgi:hypothetical protein